MTAAQIAIGLVALCVVLAVFAVGFVAGIDLERTRQRHARADLDTARARAIIRLSALVAGDGFINATGDLAAYCPMCGRSRPDGHREACPRFPISDVIALLKAGNEARP